MSNRWGSVHWLREYVGGDMQIDVFAGRDYPANLSEYKLVIHCGTCMLTRREMLLRIHQARQEGVAITNYGVCISFLQGGIREGSLTFPVGP